MGIISLLPLAGAELMNAGFPSQSGSFPDECQLSILQLTAAELMEVSFTTNPNSPQWSTATKKQAEQGKD